VEFFIWSTFYLCVVFVVSLMVGVRRNALWFKLLTLPGLLIYSACRALGCIANCTPIEKFGTLTHEEPFVKLGTTRMAYVGHFLGSVVTHAGLVACVFLAQGLIGVADWETICVPAFWTIVTYPPTFVDYLSNVKAALPWGGVGFWVALYLCAAACCNFELSLREFAAGICVTIAGAWVCGVLTWLGVHVSFLSYGWLILHYRLPEWLGVASFYLLAVSVTAIVVAATLSWTHGSHRESEKKLA
jgi:hypothetical protein